MGSAWLIAAKDLKLRVRDRSAFIIGIVAPLALAFIFNLVFGGAATGGGLGLEFGLVDEDGSETSSSFAEVLTEIEAEGVITLFVYDNRAVASEAIDSGEIDAFYALPVGLGSAVTSGGTATIDIVGDIDAPTSTRIAESIADQFATGVGAAQLAVATTAAVDPGALQRLDDDPSEAVFSYRLEDVSVATRQLDSSTFFAAGMAVFFLFFTVQFGVAGILEEERQGTLARLLAAPIGRTTVVIGKAILSFVLGVVSMGVLIFATGSLMGASWGAPLGVVLLVIAGVLAAIGIMGLISAVARTPEGAGNLGSIIAVILGMLGGTFFPVGQGSDVLSSLTLVTPHAWFLRGLGDLANGAPWTAALPSVGAIMIFAGVTGLIAWIFLGRRLAA